MHFVEISKNNLCISVGGLTLVLKGKDIFDINMYRFAKEKRSLNNIFPEKKIWLLLCRGNIIILIVRGSVHGNIICNITSVCANFLRNVIRTLIFFVLVVYFKFKKCGKKIMRKLG